MSENSLFTVYFLERHILCFARFCLMYCQEIYTNFRKLLAGLIYFNGLAIWLYFCQILTFLA